MFASSSSLPSNSLSLEIGQLCTSPPLLQIKATAINAYDMHFHLCPLQQPIAADMRRGKLKIPCHQNTQKPTNRNKKQHSHNFLNLIAIAQTQVQSISTETHQPFPMVEQSSSP
ncbi:hypothetical protein M758_1G322000 [Ceratodon purpureus]|uniref:Uncharacterized protein n=1 Tax=Ceratodon purpureus TaxID=3225 RepID=A0A8T0JEV6_CERPU|nr:hypothetical protein KC19_1G329300 [Ceratodon purpureus]KAG0632353.1 hypothetical protein M758_1G322000 [Ceratodon purpureus]